MRPTGNRTAAKDVSYLVNNQTIKMAFGNNHSHTNFSSILKIISMHITVFGIHCVALRSNQLCEMQEAQTCCVRQF
jgi:hypothetical protein